LEFAQRVAALTLAIVLVACSSDAPITTVRATGFWSMYRGDLVRDGHPAGVTLSARSAARLRLAWRTRLDGAIDGTPAVWQGIVFAGSAGGTLAALDSANGKIVWTRHGLGAISSSPTIAGDKVLVATLTGRVYAIRVADGGVVWDWQAPPGAAIWASPVVYRDVVVIGLASPYGDTPLVPGRLAGLDGLTGRERWVTCLLDGCQPGDGIWSTPAIDQQGTAFVGVGNPDDALFAFDPLTGKRRWLSSFYPDQGRDLDIGASPVIYTLNGREVVLQATVEGLIAAVDAQTGLKVWSREIVQGTAVHGLLASPAYDGRNVYAGSASAPTGIFALDASDGSTAWRYETEPPVYSAPAVGDGVVVLGTGAVFGDLRTGALIALASADGHVLFKYDTKSAVRSGPAVAGDFVAIGDYAGDVLAFRPLA